MDLAILFTGYALLAVVSVLGALAAHRYADKAAEHAARLQQSRGRIVALEHSCEALDTKLRKLAGRVYATEPRRRKPDDAEPAFLEDPDELDPEFTATLRLQTAPPPKPNGA
jgi:hypothetical protein